MAVIHARRTTCWPETASQRIDDFFSLWRVADVLRARFDLSQPLIDVVDRVGHLMMPQ